MGADQESGVGIQRLLELHNWFTSVKAKGSDKHRSDVSNRRKFCYFRDEGPKCIQVCPTKALRLVDPEAIATSISAKRQQTVAKTARSKLSGA